MYKLSIIMPIYNGMEYIQRALDSIPSRDDIEIICVDDCSTDATLELLKYYTRLPLKIYHTEVNSGVGSCTAIGMNFAEGEYITGLEVDDYFITEVFNECLNTINLGEYDIYNFSYLENDGNIRPGSNISGLPGKWIRRSFMGDIRFSNRRQYADCYFMQDLRRKLPRPKEIFLNKCYYRYNYPRKGSISYGIEHPGEN